MKKIVLTQPPRYALLGSPHFFRKNCLSLLLILCTLLLTTLSLPLSANPDCTARYIEAGAIPQGANAPWRDVMNQCKWPAALSGNGLGNTCGNRKDQIEKFCNTACPSTASKDDITACFFPPPSEPNSAEDIDKSKGQQCGSEGNPCQPSSGNKFQIESDYQSFTGELRFTRAYNSLSPQKGFLGFGWTATGLSRLQILSETEIKVFDEHGRGDTWIYIEGFWQGNSDSRMQLLKSNTHYTVRYPNGRLKTFSLSGQLMEHTNHTGRITRYDYDTSQRLTQITDSLGRNLTFIYTEKHNIQQVLTPDGPINYDYDEAQNLTQVTYPDLSSRQYHYEDTRFPHHLTGITNESGIRLSTWAYNEEGKATLSERIDAVNQVTLAYNTELNQTTVTDALGAHRIYQFERLQGVNKVINITGDPCRTCEQGHMKERRYDDNGFLSGYHDWNGNQATLVNNARGLVTRYTKAVGTPEEQVTTFQWHPKLTLPLSIDVLGQQIRFTYSATGQLLTQTVEDTASGENRTITYTYHPAETSGAGLIASIDEARDDVDDITRYDYDSLGNLSKITNALGHITLITSHDASGRPTTLSDANGVKTTLSYDLRGRLTQQFQAGNTTTYQYDAAGQLTRLTQADGRYLSFQYDAAQRLNHISDNDNNQIIYTLDALGNRTKTEITDPAGNLTQTQSAVFDELSRLQQSLGAEGQKQTLQYDANHNPLTHEDALSRTSQSHYDSLDRLIKSIDPEQQQTEVHYDQRNNLTQVTDANGLTTRYTYNGFNEITQQTSPNTGTTTFTYDKAGNLTSQTDAREITVTYRFDALNRLTAIDYPDNHLDVHHTYDQSANGKGRLTQTSDNSGTTTYTYDPRGNVLSQTQNQGNTSYTTRYRYNVANRLNGMTYPNGDSLEYLYNENGEVSSLSATLNGVHHSLLSDASYLPFGSVQKFTYGNGLSYSASHDQSYRLTQQTTTDVQDQQYRYNEANNLLALNDPLNSDYDQQFNYDTLDRLNQAQGQYGSFEYDYDAVGNRLNKNSDNQNNRYDYDTQSQKIQNITTTDTIQRYQYDAVGNTIDNGRYQFLYGEDNRLHQVQQAGQTLARYDYNAQSQRSRKQVNRQSSFVLSQLIAKELALRTQHQLQVLQLEESSNRLARVKTHRIPNPTTWRDRIIDRLIKDWIEKEQKIIETQQQNLNTSQKRLDVIQAEVADYDSLPNEDREDQHISTDYLYDLQGRLIAEITTGNHKNYIYFNGQPFAQIDNNQLYYYHNDHLGTPQRMTDKDKNIVWQVSYTPFGQVTITTESITSNLRFAGQYYDQESDLHYNYFRYYDPETGRYTTSDPIGLAGGVNTYGYALSNPVNRIDFYGLNSNNGETDGSTAIPLYLYTPYLDYRFKNTATPASSVFAVKGYLEEYKEAKSSGDTSSLFHSLQSIVLPWFGSNNVFTKIFQDFSNFIDGDPSQTPSDDSSLPVVVLGGGNSVVLPKYQEPCPAW